MKVQYYDEFIKSCLFRNTDIQVVIFVYRFEVDERISNTIFSFDPCEEAKSNDKILTHIYERVAVIREFIRSFLGN